MTETSGDSSTLQDAPVNILHFGCGTSSLGPDLSRLLQAEGVQAQIVDADYVAEAIKTDTGGLSAQHGASDMDGRAGIPLISLNVLDRDRLADTAPGGGWDLLIDKSTADAISCGASVQGVEPIHILCDNLSGVTRPGGRWLCISYSASRFDHLKSLAEDSENRGWRLLSVSPVNGAFTGDPTIVDSEKGGKRVVYAPETNVWAYVLERL